MSWVTPPVIWTVYGIRKSDAIPLTNWPPAPSCEKSGQSGKFCARNARSLVALPAGSAALKNGLVVESFAVERVPPDRQQRLIDVDVVVVEVRSDRRRCRALPRMVGSPVGGRQPDEARAAARRC